MEPSFNRPRARYGQLPQCPPRLQWLACALRCLIVRTFWMKGELAWKNYVAYTSQQFHIETFDQQHHPKWSRVLAIQRALKDPRTQYVFWIDSDSPFTNFNSCLEMVILKQSKSLAFSLPNSEAAPTSAA